MPDSLLSVSKRKKILNFISKEDFRPVISILDSVSTSHSGTAKMKDKRFVISEIVNHFLVKHKNKTQSEREKLYYIAGKKISGFGSDNAKEVGVHIIWRGYNFNKGSVTAMLLKIADDQNWEVREYAAGAISAVVYSYHEFYRTLEKWRNHSSENIRRAVVISAWGLRDKKDVNCTEKAFALLQPLLYDSSLYVKKNLGPFVIGSCFGNAFPEKTFRQLNKWIKIKHPNVRWNVAMAFNNSFGNKFPQRSLKYLEILANDPDKTVQRAVVSTLRSLRKRHKSLIEKFTAERGLKI